jgi:hypothetical protein
MDLVLESSERSLLVQRLGPCSPDGVADACVACPESDLASARVVWCGFLTYAAASLRALLTGRERQGLAVLGQVVAPAALGFPAEEALELRGADPAGVGTRHLA